MEKEHNEVAMQGPDNNNAVKKNGKELELESCDPEPPLPLTVTSRLLFMLGDITSGPAYRLAQWLEMVRKRSGRYPSSGFPHRSYRLDLLPSSSGQSSEVKSDDSPPDQAPEISLWERLSKADILDIESSSFSWDLLLSLHHTEHSSSTEQCEDDLNKALEVTVNSGGVVFFVLFHQPEHCDSLSKEAAAVIKFSSSRIATQSERLGYEFARWLGVCTPQVRVIHNCSIEWQQIKDAAEKARIKASTTRDDVGEVTCTELLEALQLSKCLLLMSYVHGSPLLESSNAFDPAETADRIANALGRVLLLDLVIRNEDRLPCRELRWRGNPRNLLLAEKVISNNTNELDDAVNSVIKRYRPRVARAFQKERRAVSVDSKISSHDADASPHGSDFSDVTDSPYSSESSYVSHTSCDSGFLDQSCYVVAIDSGVPRHPPAGKRLNDQENYPKLVELLLNSSDYAFSLLYDITGGKLGGDGIGIVAKKTEVSVVNKFRSGFRSALRDLQGFQIFLITLHQKLDNLVTKFINITNRVTTTELDKEDFVVSESASYGTPPSCSPMNKERNDNHSDLCDSEPLKGTPKPPSGVKENLDCSPCMSSDHFHGRLSRGSGEPPRSIRMANILRDFHKYAKADNESGKELEQWNDMLRNDVIKLTNENNFNTGFFEGSESNYAVDAYELKIRLEHILDRISLISDAANTEKPSQVLSDLYIGGALAAGSAHTLQHIGITHILCLCANEIGQSDSQYPDLFEYKNFSISDNEDTNISAIFEEAADFIDNVTTNGKVLVHCFEGRSRSGTLIIAYLMLRKHMTLLQAWNILKRAHRRAQPNDGFAATLLELDKKLHGRPSMEWQQRKPTMKICSICGKNAGLSNSSLKFHLQKAHKKLSSGSVDSAMTMEIKKVLDALKMTQSGSVPIARDPHSEGDE